MGIVSPEDGGYPKPLQDKLRKAGIAFGWLKPTFRTA